jgi:hypothetical protein
MEKRIRMLEKYADKLHCEISKKDAKKTKYMFEHCTKCNQLKMCYNNGKAKHPQNLEPSCGSGPESDEEI